MIQESMQWFGRTAAAAATFESGIRSSTRLPRAASKAASAPRW